MKTFTNVNLNGEYDSARAALGCEDEEFRYHIWVDCNTWLPLDTNVFKNKTESIFNTKYLSSEKGQGKAISEYLLKLLPGLIPEYKQRMEQDRKAALHQARQRRHKARKEANAEAMYDLLYEIRLNGPKFSTEHTVRTLLDLIDTDDYLDQVLRF